MAWFNSAVVELGTSAAEICTSRAWWRTGTSVAWPDTMAAVLDTSVSGLGLSVVRLGKWATGLAASVTLTGTPAGGLGTSMAWLGTVAPRLDIFVAGLSILASELGI